MNLYKTVSNTISEQLKTSINLEIPRDSSFGDFSTNIAMIKAKELKKSPIEIAKEIVPLISNIDFIENVNIAGAGFINIKIKDSFIWKSLQEEINIKTNDPKIIDMDYGSYNVAKSMHIGHLRTSIVGDTFNRIARFLGHKTISYNHMGDWGRSMGLIIAWIKKIHPELPFFKNDFNQDTKFEYTVSIDELNTYYPNASKLAKEDENFMEEARKITSELQKGHTGYTALYNSFIPVSLKEMERIINKLDMLPFDNNLGEKNAAEYIEPVEKILRSKNLLEKSDGAEIINVKKDTDTAPMPPVMFYNSRGAVPYDATDIGALYYRKITDNPDYIIYLTDARQNLHFQQLFRVSDLMDLFPSERLEHIGYGTINGKDGKPFKTRDGNAAGLVDIMEIVNSAVKQRIKDSDKNLDSDTVDMISLAALKFNDLIHDLRSDYIFDVDALTSFEGKTGPYILYTAVRLNSILNKLEINEKIDFRDNIILSNEERDLSLCLLDFERIINIAFENRATDVLASYTYNLCQVINIFYHNCPIISENVEEEQKQIRIKIVQKSLEILSKSIDLMGLKIPKEM